MNSPSNSNRRIGIRYAAAIFLSSFLLFLLEPIAGKRILPLLGGSAAVWTACLVFFQCALLLGYFLAHWLVTRASPRMQVVLYVGLLALSLTQLFLAVNPALRADTSHPIMSVLSLLTMLIGLPFVTLSATSPLLQAWYARSMAGAAADGSPGTTRPYRLFAVSNIGSLLALLIYPWLVEPRFSLREQGVTLAAGFTVLAAVTAAIAASMWATPLLSLADTVAAGSSDEQRDHGGLGDRVLWVGLAACGSLLLSAVTNHLSQNVATIPLLWVIPLVAYLLSFVAAFGGAAGGGWIGRSIVFGLGIAGMGSSGYLLYHGDLYMSITRVVAIHCAALFSVCLFCHCELYRRRPAANRLTAFYFFVAAGGAIGAILVGVVAPMVLTGNYELAMGLCLAGVLGLAATWAGGWPNRILWAGAAVAMGIVVKSEIAVDRDNNLLRSRNFYGTLHVTQASDSSRQAVERTLYHGVIEHGQQVYREDLHETPTTYYGHISGVGLAMDLCCDDRPRRVGVIGLGTGTMAAYGRPGDVIRFYDINPAVEPIARNYFTYLRDSPAKIEIVTGDARVSLSAEPPQNYDVIVVDAFSGDAIPVHLITIQALELYRRHLSAHGIVAFHVSNRYLALPPVVEELAERAGMKTAFISSGDDLPNDVFSADWVLVTADETFLARPEVTKVREEIKIPAGLRLWTDDYNSLLPILRFRGTESQ